MRALKPSWAAASVTTRNEGLSKLVADSKRTPTIRPVWSPRHAEPPGGCRRRVGIIDPRVARACVAPSHGDRADLRRLAMWLTVDEPGLRPFLDEAVATVQAVSKKEFWAEAKASPECHEEVPFAIRVDRRGRRAEDPERHDRLGVPPGGGLEDRGLQDGRRWPADVCRRATARNSRHTSKPGASSQRPTSPR